MLSRHRRTARPTRPRLIHLTTTDISLALLLLDQLKAFGEAGYEVIGVSRPGPFVDQIESAGIRHVPLLNATRSMSLSADLRTADEFRSIVHRLQPDVVHTHNPKPGVYGRILAGICGVPAVVNTVHGLYATDDDSIAKRSAVYGLERLAACFSDMELVQNEEDLTILERLRIPAARLKLLGNGIDLRRFSTSSVSHAKVAQFRSSLGATKESVLVVAAGRLVWEKGYAELFACARQISRTHPNVIFAVAGPTDPSKPDAIGQTELDNATRSGVRLLGLRPDMEVVYAASDIYVLASHREGFPRSAMEASAMGLPVVATDIRGCRQVVDHGTTGLLVPIGDVNGLAGAISSLLDNPDLRGRLGAAGARKAQQAFDQQDVIDKTMQVYADLLRRESS